MKRKIRKRKFSFFENIKDKMKEKIVSILTMVIISWILGILNHIQNFNIIKELKIDNEDLNWAVDYYRK